MCDLCHQHGEGGKWFLQAKNYADDLLSDLRRRNYIQAFARHQRGLIGRPEPLDRYAGLPWPLKPIVRAVTQHRLHSDHFGQVVTMEEVRGIIGLVTSIVRLPCVCRRITLGGEHRYCFGFSMSPGGLGAAGVIGKDYWRGPDLSGLERLESTEALALLEDFDAQGLVHSVWTFKTPYIGGLCNCDATGCRAMKGNLGYGLRIMHPGESTALVGADCTGCRRCLTVCPFGAARYDSRSRTVYIDRGACHGCGLCLNRCPSRVITMVERGG